MELTTNRGIQVAQQFFPLFLINLYIYIYVRLREACKNGIYMTENIPHTICLMLVDDIANRSDTDIQLQNQLYIVTQFCSDTGMEIYLD